MAKRLYDSRRWRLVAKIYLQANPLCVLCQQQDRTTAATLVDHITPHNNNPALFWDSANWQSLCQHCHSGIKQVTDNNAYSQACDITGKPTDNKHPWNKINKNNEIVGAGQIFKYYQYVNRSGTHTRDFAIKKGFLKNGTAKKVRS